MVAKRAVPKLEEIRLNRELADISGQIREASQKKIVVLEADLTQERSVSVPIVRINLKVRYWASLMTSKAKVSQLG